MSDELAQDEADAEDYDLDAMDRGRDDDEETLVGGRQHSRGISLPTDEVVFEIGDDDHRNSVDSDTARKSNGPPSGRANGDIQENQRLMS
jgi:hypothetical protein